MVEMQTMADVEAKTSETTTRTVSVSRFLKAETDDYGEYIRLFADSHNRQLRAYKKVGETQSGKPAYWRIVIDNFRITERSDGDRTPVKYDLHTQESKTFETWLDTFKAKNHNPACTLTWYETNNSPMIDETNLNQESLIFKWTNENRKKEIQIDGLYKNDIQKIADF